MSKILVIEDQVIIKKTMKYHLESYSQPDLVMDMKTFSRIDRAKVESANINEAIEATLCILVHEYKDRIEIKRELDKDIPNVKCFIAELNHVF